MNQTQRRSVERFNNRNRLETAKKRPRAFIHTPRGYKLTTEEFLKPLVDFLAGKLDVQPDKPPRFLRKLVRELDDPLFLALAALAPLLDCIFRGWDRDDPSTDQNLKRKIGEDLYRQLRKKKIAGLTPWKEGQKVQAGHWLLWQALTLNVFYCPPDDFPRISDEWLPRVEQLREHMIAACPDYAPLLAPPAPWTGWEKSCDGFRATVVRDWRPETKTAIDVAFLNPAFEHAAGVNALASVPLKIDPVMLDLVERFAVDVMDSSGRERRADEFTVAADVADAKWVGDRAFWNDYSCDRRGRVYALQNLNFGRGDHVRSLFRFVNGKRLGGDTRWLEIHCANCEGSTDKLSRDDRIKWVADHRQDIRDIASDPVGTFDKWRDAGFAFVAACRELAAAWDDPEDFVTHLPIGFDGSANGLQHLSLLIDDWVACWMVNLLPTDDDSPSDIYDMMITRAIGLIEADDCDDANWWRERLRKLSQKQRRKLLKPPVMTFAYSVTAYGATDQIAEAYKSFRQNAQPSKDGFRYLADKVLKACALELAGPKSVMDHICALAERCADENRFLEWTSPSGFPVSNRYQKLKMVTVNCMSGKLRIAQHRVAGGVTNKINRKKVVSAAAPNFIHSLDAAHLIKVVNAAVSEGITDLLTVHDCFYCLAPQASRLQEIILGELAALYHDNDPLTDLCVQNATDMPFTRGRIPFPLHRLKDAKNAFG
jgi:DNA-directed RNA polymerase